MPFPWKDLVDLARYLEQRATGAPNAEALLRSALNRAYFGAFGHAKNYATLKHGFQAASLPEDHPKLINHFRQRPKFKGVWERLHELRLRRNEADYADDSNLQWTMAAAESVRDAAWIIQALASS
jgi:hypothetical protein